MVQLSARTRSIVTAIGFLTGAYDMFILNIGELDDSGAQPPAGNLAHCAPE